MIRIVLSLLFLASCAHESTHRSEAPDWTKSVRNGDEGLKVQHGSKIFYRRVAGSAEFSKQTSCELVVFKVEEDLKKEFPSATQIPYTVESLYYDDFHQDCAVTISINNHFERSPAAVSSEIPQELERLEALKSKEYLSDDEVAEILSLRTEIVKKYAMTGLSIEEFQKFSHEKVSKIESNTLCSKSFKTHTFSIHGAAEICWLNDHIQGYCTPKSNQCWMRSPF